MDLTPLETKNLSGSVSADSHAERSLITSKVGVGSGGITSANMSRGFGTGAGSRTGHDARVDRGGVVTGERARAGAEAAAHVRGRDAAWADADPGGEERASAEERRVGTECRARVRV